MRALLQVAAAVPLSDIMPTSEGVTGASGTGAKASRDDHAHKRLTSTTAATLDANGEATITFTRAFTQAPGMSIMAIEDADNGAMAFKVRSWVMTSGQVTGCVIKGYRMRSLPASIALLTVLVSFRVDAGSASGVPVTIIALERSG